MIFYDVFQILNVRREYHDVSILFIVLWLLVGVVTLFKFALGASNVCSFRDVGCFHFRDVGCFHVTLVDDEFNSTFPKIRKSQLWCWKDKIYTGWGNRKSMTGYIERLCHYCLFFSCLAFASFGIPCIENSNKNRKSGRTLEDVNSFLSLLFKHINWSGFCLGEPYIWHKNNFHFFEFPLLSN